MDDSLRTGCLSLADGHDQWIGTVMTVENYANFHGTGFKIAGRISALDG
jgi:hypothetical protein